MTKGAVRPLQRRPATKVWVFQWPNGALDRSRRPLRPGPVDEDEAMRLKPHPGLARGYPFVARLFDVGTILLAGQQRFF